MASTSLSFWSSASQVMYQSAVHQSKIERERWAYFFFGELRMGLVAPEILGRLEIDWMSFWRSCRIFFPHLDRLVCFASDEPRTRQIICEGVNSSLAVQRS